MSFDNIIRESKLFLQYPVINSRRYFMNKIKMMNIYGNTMGNSNR